MNEQVGRGREGRLTLEGEVMKNEEGQILLTGARGAAHHLSLHSPTLGSVQGTF